MLSQFLLNTYPHKPQAIESSSSGRDSHPAILYIYLCVPVTLCSFDKIVSAQTNGKGNGLEKDAQDTQAHGSPSQSLAQGTTSIKVKVSGVAPYSALEKFPSQPKMHVRMLPRWARNRKPLASVARKVF